MDNPDLNPWKAGQVSGAEPPKLIHGCGGIHLLISAALMFPQSSFFEELTNGNRLEHFLGDPVAIALSLIATCVSIFFSVRGSFVSSSAIRNPEKNLVAACVFFLLNFILATSLSVCLLSYVFSFQG